MDAIHAHLRSGGAVPARQTSIKIVAATSDARDFDDGASSHTSADGAACARCRVRKFSWKSGRLRVAECLPSRWRVSSCRHARAPQRDGSLQFPTNIKLSPPPKTMFHSHVVV